MNIRFATVEDAAGVARVHIDSWRSTYQDIIPDDYLARLSYAERELFWRQILTELPNDSFVYVADAGADDGRGPIAGFVSGGPERSGDTVSTGEIYAIYLLAAYQGQGLGRELMRTLATRLIQEGMTALRLWVLADNPARQFYERLGGCPVAEKTILVGGVPLLEIAYAWRDAHTITTASP